MIKLILLCKQSWACGFESSTRKHWRTNDTYWHIRAYHTFLWSDNKDIDFWILIVDPNMMDAINELLTWRCTNGRRCTVNKLRSRTSDCNHMVRSQWERISGMYLLTSNTLEKQLNFVYFDIHFYPVGNRLKFKLLISAQHWRITIVFALSICILMLQNTKIIFVFTALK